MLVWPPSLSRVHSVFHVFMLWKNNKIMSHDLGFLVVHLDENSAYKEDLIAILERQVWKLRLKDITSVKVVWKGQQSEEAT